MIFLRVLMLWAIAAGALALPGEAEAQRRLDLDPNRHYVMMLYTGTRDPILQHGVFCMARNGEVLLTASAHFAMCGQNEMYALGAPSTGTRYLDHDEFIGSASLMTLFYRTRPLFGRMFLRGIRGTSYGPRNGGAVLFFDSKPGTITVIPVKRQPAQEALAKAREALEVHGYADVADRFKLELIRAAVVTCGQKSGRAACVLGQEVPYPKIVIVPIIIPLPF